MSGVGKKINRQIDSWKSAGHEVKFFMHTVRRNDDATLIPSEPIYYTVPNKLVGEWNRIHAVYTLLDMVRNYHPDLVYIRYGMYVYPVHALSEFAPLIEEITTNDLGQHGGLGVFYGVYNRLTRGILIRNTSGLVCLSNELANATYNAVYKKPTCVIGDGIDLKNIHPLPAPNNERPKIAFIGSPDSVWQGVDKLPILAKACPDLEIHIIGYDGLDGVSFLPSNLNFYGYLGADDYKNVLADMDCAIGSLALHRIHLNESSPLKTRECLAFGLPMVLPYHDTDLHDLQADFLLKIPNKEDNILTHAQAIRTFAYQMRGQRVDRRLISHLNQDVKEQKRIAFFQQVLETFSELS